jgi:predicted nucleic acid-binding protein
MDAFDADVLVYAATRGHDLGRRVRRLFTHSSTGDHTGIGSVLLLPELLSRPLRDGNGREVRELSALLARLDLRPMDASTAALATALGASYRLRAADATHLATAVQSGAERFITNNRRDFASSITEIDITYPEALPLR